MSKPQKNILKWSLQTPSQLTALLALIVLLATHGAAFTIGHYTGDRAREQRQINAAYSLDVCRDKPDFIKCIDFFSQAVKKPFNKPKQ